MLSLVRYLPTGEERTIEVLTIELLDELQHHAVDRSFPKGIAGRETFRPCSFSIGILSTDRKHQLFNKFFDERIVQRDTVQFSDDRPRFHYPVSS